MSNHQSEFPKFQIIIDNVEHWLPLGTAGRELNSYWCPVRIGSKALEATGVTREITIEERNKMIDIADEFDANK